MKRNLDKNTFCGLQEWPGCGADSAKPGYYQALAGESAPIRAAPRGDGDMDDDDQIVAGERRKALDAWLAGTGRASGATITTASEDASFRRYFRATTATGTLIVMDAPPAREDSRSFVDIAAMLADMGLNAPRVLSADLEQGFLLLTDLGADVYLDRLVSHPEEVDSLYDAALAALARLQDRGAAFQSRLPAYGADLLQSEMSLFHDWLCGIHLGLDFTATEELEWRRLCATLIRNALDQPQVFVHRDFHSRNLMVTPADSPGLLDFQDAVEGPLTYDLVSLLKDCYFSLPPDVVLARVDAFYLGLPEARRAGISVELFRRYFELMGVQRHLKAAGIFARLYHRDGKARYLADIPRTLGYVSALSGRYPELRFLVGFLETRVLPALAVHP